jgi:hypothetical protein
MLYGASAMNIYSAKFSQDKKFYVYEYLRKNSSKNGSLGSPFYVGKGTNNRAFQTDHFVKTPKDKNRILIISNNLSEADAFQLEILLIYFYGRIDTKTGCLRNRTDGGEGPVGKIISTQSRNKMSKSRIGSKNHMFGKSHSSETKQKISDKLKGHGKGRTMSAITKQRIASARKGKKYPRQLNIIQDGR